MIEIYTDGSFNKNYPNVCGYAVIVVIDNKVTDIVFGVTTESIYTSAWNVGGEIKAVEVAVNDIRNKYNPDKMIIYHDYIGVSHWAIGSWKTNNPLTRSYKEFMSTKINKPTMIGFKHVKGHSGNKYNDMADEFARKAISIYNEQGIGYQYITP